MLFLAPIQFGSVTAESKVEDVKSVAAETLPVTDNTSSVSRFSMTICICLKSNSQIFIASRFNTF